jgi:hypothetical protein
MAALLAGSVLALATAAYAAPLVITGTDLPATTIQAAGGGPLLPGTISANAIGAFQVANFLENLVCSGGFPTNSFSAYTVVRNPTSSKLVWPIFRHGALQDTQGTSIIWLLSKRLQRKRWFTLLQSRLFSNTTAPKPSTHVNMPSQSAMPTSSSRLPTLSHQSVSVLFSIYKTESPSPIRGWRCQSARS